ncbi:hypothetical protein [Clostridium sp. MSJ-8]|nr:hypothetical protein [Clostridium sp. MSJ-8]
MLQTAEGIIFAYITDNQAGTIHIRSMIQTSEHDAFVFSMNR